MQAPDDVFHAEVKRSLAMLSAAFRRTGRDPRRIVWLSTFASLPGCTSLPDPLPTDRAEALLRSLSGHYKEAYHWGVKESQNAISRQAVEGVGGSYFEAFHATMVRPGGHRGVLDRAGNAARNRTVVEDCVHWCLPGPLDSLTRLLLAYLSE